MDAIKENIKQYSILYVGTDSTILSQLKKDQYGFAVNEADNPLRAMNFFEEGHHVDAILCENHIYGMRGVDFVAQYKDRPEFKTIPFIMVQHPGEKIPEDIIKLGLDDVYTLPLDSQKLHERIDFLRGFKKRKLEKKSTSVKEEKYRVPFVKRTFDILFSLVAIVVLSPILIIAALAIRLESKGKVYYTSKRVGTGYQIFDFYKLRSMRIGADKMIKQMADQNQYAKEANAKEAVDESCPRCDRLGHACSPTLHVDGKEICEHQFLKQKKQKSDIAFVKIKDDPRVTKVGKIIRNSSIDELPQLFNVLKGDMSIVGNRPLPLYEAELLTTDDWTQRFNGPAGITGLWQVMKRGRSTKMSPEERKMLDNEYAENYSFWNDIVIIIRTFKAVFQKENV